MRCRWVTIMLSIVGMVAVPVMRAEGAEPAAQLRDQIERLERAGRRSATVPLYARLLQLAPDDSVAVHGYAGALREQQRYDLIADLMTDWTRQRPHDFQAHVVLGNALLRLNRLQKAMDTFQKALDHGPPLAARFRVVADQYRAAGYHREAIHFLEQSREVLSQPRLFAWELAQAYLRTGATGPAVEALAHTYLSHPDRYPLVHTRILELLRHEDAIPEVLQTLDHVLEHYEDDPAAARLGLLAAISWLEAGRPEAGLERLTRMAVRSEVAALLCNYAAHCAEKGHRAVAAQSYGLCAERSDDTDQRHRAVLEQAGLFEQLGEPHSAADLYRQLVRDRPDHPLTRQAQVHLARLQLYELGDAAAARDMLQEVVDREDEDRLVLLARELLAEASLRQNDLEAAVMHLDQAAVMAPDTAFASHFRRAEIYLLLGRIDSTSRQLEELLTRNPGHALANDALELLWLCDTLGNQAEATERYTAALLADRQGRTEQAKLDWQWLEANASPQVRQMALFHRARTHLEQADPATARELFSRLVEEHPRSPYRVPAQLAVAALLEQADDTAAALKELENALLTAPEPAHAPEIRLSIQRLREGRNTPIQSRP